MGRGNAANMAINTFHGACIKIPYLTSGPVAHATGLVGAWTTMLNCFQFLLVMHRGGSYHFPKALAAKHHFATHLPDDIEGLESVVKPVRSAITSMHRLHAKHIEKICAKVSTVISYLVVKTNKASAQGFGDWVCEAIAGGR